MSQFPVLTVVTVTNQVTNYPVLLGDLAEIHSYSRLPSVVLLRLLSIEQITSGRITIAVGHQNVDPDIFEADCGMRIMVSYRDVVLPFWCFFWNPVAW